MSPILHTGSYKTLKAKFGEEPSWLVGHRHKWCVLSHPDGIDAVNEHSTPWVEGKLARTGYAEIKRLIHLGGGRTVTQIKRVGPFCPIPEIVFQINS